MPLSVSAFISMYFINSQQPSWCWLRLHMASWVFRLASEPQLPSGVGQPIKLRGQPAICSDSARELTYMANTAAVVCSPAATLGSPGPNTMLLGSSGVSLSSRAVLSKSINSGLSKLQSPLVQSRT